MKVITSCCSRFHIFDQANQLYQHKKLYKIIHCGLKSKAKKMGIPIEFQENNFFIALMCHFSNKFPFSFSNAINHSISKMTDNFIKKKLLKMDISNIDIFIGLSSFCLNSFKYLNKKKIIKVLDHGSLHPIYEREIIKAECNKLSIDSKYFIAPDWQINRIVNEINESDFIMLLSKKAKDSFIKYGVDENKIFVNHCGVDRDLFKYRPLKKFNDFTFLYCGQISPRKGVHKLIDAFNNINIKNSRLIIIGSFSLSKEYNHLIRSKSLGKNISFYGSIKQDSLSKIFSQSHVFVLPSFADGFGLVTTQALAANMKVLISKNAGSSEIVPNNIDIGYEFDINNLNELQNKMFELFFNYDHHNNMIDNSFIENLNWKNYGNRLNNFLNELVKK